MAQNVWATIMPFGQETLIIYWPKFFFFSGQPLWLALISGTVYTGIQIMIFIQLSFNIILYNTILGTPVSSTIIN